MSQTESPTQSDERAETEQQREAAAEHSLGRLSNQGGMDRVSVRMPDAMLDVLAEEVEAGRFSHRTAAVRAAIRETFMQRGGER